MNNLVKINNQELGIKEFKGQRIVTFRDIDTLHERPEGTARKRFNDNKKHFIQNADYFVRNSYEAKNEFGITAPNGLMLITESGYLMLVKSLQDDLAWTVQRELVNNYFRPRPQLNVVNELKVELTNMINDTVAEKMDEIETKCSKYFRPVSLEKYNISQYIKKRLGIAKANDEYELVKQRVLIKLGGTKWEDIPVETLVNSLNIIDESIRIIKADRKFNQVSLFDSNEVI